MTSLGGKKCDRGGGGGGGGGGKGAVKFLFARRLR